ncbi:MAG: sigma-70 family RNA polymerase sigma factor [Gaiellaceae bacterium]
MNARSDSGEFGAAVAALLKNEGTFESREMQVVVNGLSRYLLATVIDLNHDDLAETIQLSLVEFLEAVRAGRVDKERSPAGYLIRLARWRALDFVRGRARHEVPTADLEPEEEDADVATEALAALSSEEQIALLLRHNRLEGRHDLNAVVRAWLDLADFGGTPTVRAVAAKLGIAPSTVSARLAQLREILSALERT